MAVAEPLACIEGRAVEFEDEVEVKAKEISLSPLSSLHSLTRTLNHQGHKGIE